MSELFYWSRLGYEPKYLAEISNGVLVLAYAYKKEQFGEEQFLTFVCATRIDPSGRIQAYTTFSVPLTELKRIEKFNPQKNSFLMDIFRGKNV